ncbi:O-antigen ligase family protein [Streptomyces sp. NBC_00448]|uniref:O-antigen ligase family protein n=1 Tax=Streptomyces sp. NBC_00448 TaxID=2903652 RepID=UPI002E23073E
MDTTAGGAPEAARGARAAAEAGPRRAGSPEDGRAADGTPEDDPDGSASGSTAADGTGSALFPDLGDTGDTGGIDDIGDIAGSPPQPVRPARPPSGGGAVDAAGMVVLACCAVWVMVCAGGREARPEGALLALLAVTAGYAAGRVLGAMLPTLTLTVGAVTVLALVLGPAHRLSGGASAPPLGYPNADAALLVLAAGAACCAAWGVPDTVWRVPSVVWQALLRLLALAAAVAALVLGSSAGFTAGVAVVLCSLAAARMRHRLIGLVGLALAAALAVGGSYAVAVDAAPGGLSESLTGQLTQPRVALWHEAVHLAGRHPLRGVGPGRFAEESTPLPSDTPTAETPQSAPFQLAAEQGVPGVALLGGAYLWTLCALWRSPRSTPAVLTAAATLTGLGLLAAVDHVLSYTAVTAAAGLLAGLATSRPLPAQAPAPAPKPSPKSGPKPSRKQPMQKPAPRPAAERASLPASGSAPDR